MNTVSYPSAFIWAPRLGIPGVTYIWKGTVPSGRKAMVFPVRNSNSELAVVPPNTEE